VIAQKMVIPNPRAAFYLPVTRAWELALGCSLALAPIAATASRQVRSALGILGLGMVLGAVFLYTSETPFPGAAALLPCVGTALIVWAGSGSERTQDADIFSLGPLTPQCIILFSIVMCH